MKISCIGHIYIIIYQLDTLSVFITRFLSELAIQSVFQYKLKFKLHKVGLRDLFGLYQFRGTSIKLYWKEFLRIRANISTIAWEERDEC